MDNQQDNEETNYIKCPECYGTGEDLEDSSKNCYNCNGEGVVKKL